MSRYTFYWVAVRTVWTGGTRASAPGPCRSCTPSRCSRPRLTHVAQPCASLSFLFRLGYRSGRAYEVGREVGMQTMRAVGR
jgi:hypothetical protein